MIAWRLGGLLFFALLFVLFLLLCKERYPRLRFDSMDLFVFWRYSIDYNFVEGMKSRNR